MNLLEKLKRHWTPLLSFEIMLGGNNQVCVKTMPRQPSVDHLEMVRFWAFTTARILYEVWFINTPQAFLALDLLSLIFEREVDPGTDCLRRSRLNQFHYVFDLSNPDEEIAGEYLGHDSDERSIRFRVAPTFDGNMAGPLVMVAGAVLLQCVLDRIKTDVLAVQTLSQTGRNLITQFALKEWAGSASMEKLPQAAFSQALAIVRS